MAVLSRAVRESTHRRILTEQSYRELFNATGDGIFLVDPVSSRVIDVNKGTFSILGLNWEEKDRFDIAHLAGVGDAFQADKLSQQIAGATGELLQMEWEIHSPSRGKLWLELSARAGVIEEQARVICILRDVTERRALLHENEQSERLRSVGLLARGVAHDFNNQLTGIMASSSLLEAGLPPGSPLLELNEAIMACSRRSADLTRQLLAFARQGQGQLIAVDVDDLVYDVCTFLRRSIEKKVQIIHLPNSQTLHVMGDPSFLQNAILNLGLNARDAMGEGGTLEFEVSEAKEQGDSVLIRVSDTGVAFLRT